MIIYIIIAFIVFIGIPIFVIIWGGLNIIKTIQLEKELKNKMGKLLELDSEQKEVK